VVNLSKAKVDPRKTRCHLCDAANTCCPTSTVVQEASTTQGSAPDNQVVCLGVLHHKSSHCQCTLIASKKHAEQQKQPQSSPQHSREHMNETSPSGPSHCICSRRINNAATKGPHSTPRTAKLPQSLQLQQTPAHFSNQGHTATKGPQRTPGTASCHSHCSCSRLQHTSIKATKQPRGATALKAQPCCHSPIQCNSRCPLTPAVRC
jgi:hypothetical protein